MKTIYQDLATGNLYTEARSLSGRILSPNIGDLVCYNNDDTYTLTRYTPEMGNKCIKLTRIEDDYLKTMIAAC